MVLEQHIEEIRHNPQILIDTYGFESICPTDSFIMVFSDPNTVKFCDEDFFVCFFYERKKDKEELYTATLTPRLDTEELQEDERAKLDFCKKLLTKTYGSPTINRTSYSESFSWQRDGYTARINDVEDWGAHAGGNIILDFAPDIKPEKLDIITNGTATKDNLAGKIIFWDIDGTLAPYRINGHVFGKEDYMMHAASDEEIAAHAYLLRDPSRKMQKIVAMLDNEQYVLSAVHHPIERADKKIWTAKNFPEIKDAFFCDSKENKVDRLITIAEELELKREDVCLVDDTPDNVKKAEQAGFMAWHISSFLDFDI